MSDKPTVGQVIENMQEQMKLGRDRHSDEIFLIQDEACVLLDAIREMQGTVKRQERHINALQGISLQQNCSYVPDRS